VPVDPKQPFARLRFSGKRYGGPVFPVEVLPELSAYRDLVVAAARALYLRDHPERQKVPRGFEASFHLVLDHIEEGSSMPVLSRLAVASAVVGLQTAVVDDYYERARQLVEDTASAANTPAQLPELASSLFEKFSQFGRLLQLDETIFLSAPGVENDGAAYNADIRKKLMLRLSDEYWDEVAYIGEINELNRTRGTFQLTTFEGKTIALNFQPRMFHQLADWLKESPVVMVKARARYRADGRLVEHEVESVSLAVEDSGDSPVLECSVDLDIQFAGLQALKAGWLDGQGRAYDSSALHQIRSVLEMLIRQHQLPRPYLYPTSECDVRAEWDTESHEVVATFNEAGDKIWLYATSKHDDSEIEQTYTSRMREEVQQLGLELRSLLGGNA
jgi:hypothetical protein